MNIEGLITDLAFLLLLGAIVTILFKWIKQPVVLGYIVAGFFASPNFEYLPSVNTIENIDFWAQIGIIVLLFALGLEFSYKKLINSGGSAVVTALIIVTGMMAAGFAIGHFSGLTPINSLFLGGMLSMSSTTIVLKAFNDLGLRQKKFTQLVLAVLVVEDLFAVVMMVLLSSIAINNSVEGGELLYSVLKLVFFLAIWFLVGIFILPSLFNSWRRFLNNETLLIVSMGLCLGMAVFSVYCGFSRALGAFVMGSILAGTSYAERIEHVVSSVRDLFGAVFFISVGMMVQPSVIAEYWPSILILSAVVIIGMIVFGTCGMLVTGQTLKVAMASGFSLVQIGEFSFIIANLGLSIGVLSPEIYPIVVAVSVLTTFGTPYFIKMAPGAYDFVERHLPKNSNLLIERYQEEASRSNAVKRKWPKMLMRFLLTIVIYSVILIAIMLASYTWLQPWLEIVVPRWSQQLCTIITLVCMLPFLLALTKPIDSKVVDKDAVESADIRTSVPSIIFQIISGIIAFWFVVSLFSWHYTNTVGILTGVILILAFVIIMSRKFKKEIGKMETKFIDNLNERDLRRTGKKTTVAESDLHVAHMIVGNACTLAGQKLMDSDLRRKYGVTVVNIIRNSEFIAIPSGRERIYPGDVIGVVGTDDQIAKLLPIMEAKKPEEKPLDPQDYELKQQMLSDTSPLVGLTPVSAKLREQYEVLLVSVQRNNEYLDPTPDLTFQVDDILWVYGTDASLKQLS